MTKTTQKIAILGMLVAADHSPFGALRLFPAHGTVRLFNRRYL